MDSDYSAVTVCSVQSYANAIVSPRVQRTLFSDIQSISPQRSSRSSSPGQRPTSIENTTSSFMSNGPTILLSARRYFDSMGQPLLDRLIDSAHKESIDFPSKTEKHSPAASPESRSVRNLALQSIAAEMQLCFTIDQDDSEPIFSKHVRKHDKLAQKAADDFHTRLIACD